MKKFFRIFLLAVLVAIVAGTFVFLYKKSKPAETTYEIVTVGMNIDDTVRWRIHNSIPQNIDNGLLEPIDIDTNHGQLFINRQLDDLLIRFIRKLVQDGSHQIINLIEL